SIALAGSLAIVSDMRQCAWLGYPSSWARAARSVPIRGKVLWVSLSPPLSPRFLNAFHTCSRRSRRDDAARNGSTLDRVLTTAHLPSSLRSAAACAYVALSDGESPARSRSPSTIQVFSSARTFLLNSA